jgi:hypothetical protein
MSTSSKGGVSKIMGGPVCVRHTVSAAAVIGCEKHGHGYGDLREAHHQTYCLRPLGWLLRHNPLPHHPLNETNSRTLWGGKTPRRTGDRLRLETQSDPGVLYGPTFIALFTYSIGPSMDSLNLSRASLARALNPVPGNQSGIWRTVQRFVGYL